MKILLIILGAPLWIPLLIAFFAVLLSICISMWSLFLSLFVCGLSGIAGFGILVSTGHQLVGFAVLGAGLVCLGFAILMFFVSKVVTKGSWLLVKKVVSGS